MRISGLSDIAGNYAGMLIDQFGVLHDGEKLYPGTLETLAELHRRGIAVVVMTNSGKRATANRERLTRLGIPRDLYLDAVSSGEVAYQELTALLRHGEDAGEGDYSLRSRLRSALAHTGSSRADAPNAFIIGRKGDAYGFDGIPLVGDPRESDVILILGSDAPRTSLDDYRRMFEGLVIPAICCNPDRYMLKPSGLEPAPGAIATLYEEMGGDVIWIGKPYPAIYCHALKLLDRRGPVLCIGDSPEHDVAGGRNAGLQVLLVRTGVSEGKSEFDPYPDYLADRFSW
jgi:HAD superfamily hydrolase (TIGR01450 family)